jgi:transcriptional regulator with XRE-family HTH domain
MNRVVGHRVSSLHRAKVWLNAEPPGASRTVGAAGPKSGSDDELVGGVLVEAAAGARIREQRQARGLSLRELGARVGVSASMLSQVENGRCRASVATLYRLVNELGMTLDDLFDGAEPAPKGGASTARRSPPAAAPSRTPTGPVLSPGERVRIELESGVTWEKLSNSGPPGLEFILVTYRPGSSSGQSGKFSQHEGFECAYIESGELTFHHKFDTWTLRAGDTVTFDAAEPHRLENTGDEDVRAVWIVLRDAAHQATLGHVEMPAVVHGATVR